MTVADAQGLSYYGAATLGARLHLSAQELGVARGRLIELDLIAYQAPLYQVLSLSKGAPPRATGIGEPALARQSNGGAVSLAQLLEMERGRARL